MERTLLNNSGKIACTLILASGSFLQAQQKPLQNKTNIVFILADDMGWKDLGCYGNRFNETPNLDKLAESGLRFTQAYAACPVCSPTRASIMTGKYPARLQLTNFIGGTRTDPNSPVLPANWQQYLESREITVPELLKQKGYTTGMVGKWHLGDKDSIAPWGQGFDYTRMIGKNGLDYYNYSIFIDSYQKEFSDHGTVYMTDKLTEYGVDFIRLNTKKPFFLYLAYSAPHILTVPRADKLRKYFLKYEKFGGKYNPNYAAMMESLDAGVGKIIQTLKDQGLLENTLIIFTSDNGGLGLDELGPVPTSNAPLRKWKGHIYEGGTRVPAIVSWKGKIVPGKVSDSYFSTIDYLPTICDLTGIRALPENIDGQSILPLYLNPVVETKQTRPLFWHYPHFSNQLGRPAGSVRVGDYKLVELFESGKLELYNLKEDISESDDLSEKMSQKTKELHQLLVDWRKQMNAQMPIKKADSLSPRIDSHIHLYDTRREGSSVFLDPVKHRKIYYPHFAKQFTDETSSSGVGYAIVIEASRRRQDNFWLMNHVDTSAVLVAFIANLDPRDPWYVQDIDSLSTSKKFRGIRIRTDTPINLADPQIVAKFAELDKRKLVLELQVPDILPETVTNIARLYPGMNIIIDHLAGGKIYGDQNDREKWIGRLAILSSEPNVYCKISSIFDFSGQNPAPLNSKFYDVLIDPVVNAFGPDRVIFGSNWTLSDMFGKYSDMIRVLDEYCQRRVDLSTRQLYYENAKKAYKF